MDTKISHSICLHCKLSVVRYVTSKPRSRPEGSHFLVNVIVNLGVNSVNLLTFVSRAL